jgi:hypothetical protein
LRNYNRNIVMQVDYTSRSSTSTQPGYLPEHCLRRMKASYRRKPASLKTSIQRIFTWKRPSCFPMPRKHWTHRRSRPWGGNLACEENRLAEAGRNSGSSPPLLNLYWWAERRTAELCRTLKTRCVRLRLKHGYNYETAMWRSGSRFQRRRPSGCWAPGSAGSC